MKHTKRETAEQDVWYALWPHQKICISVGKYRSDRLALELKKLREALERTSDTDGIVDECRALLSQLQEVITDNQELTVEDFASSKGAKV